MLLFNYKSSLILKYLSILIQNSIRTWTEQIPIFASSDSFVLLTGESFDCSSCKLINLITHSFVNTRTTRRPTNPHIFIDRNPINPSPRTFPVVSASIRADKLRRYNAPGQLPWRQMNFPLFLLSTLLRLQSHRSSRDNLLDCKRSLAVSRPALYCCSSCSAAADDAETHSSWNVSDSVGYCAGVASTTAAGDGG